MKIVICYDISDTKRRNEVAKILEGHGYRVQYSVFECELNKEQLKRLKQRLGPLVKAQEWESIRFYPLYAHSAENVEVIGKDLARELGAIWVVKVRE
jgi:CRISPR-associated protein Cas2